MRLFNELVIVVSERRDPMEPDSGTEQYNQKINTWNGIFKAMALRLVNPFLGINLIRLGAPNIDLGILDAVPSIAGGVVALLGTPWLSRRRDPHRTTMHLFLLARGFYLVFALIDVLARGPGVAATWMLLAIVAMDMPSALATLSWQSMTTQMFSARTRVTAVMWRQWGMNLVGLVTVIIGGVAISSDPSVHGYIVLYTVAAVFGFVEVTIYRKFRVTGMAPVMPGNWVEVVPRLMKRTPFRRFVIAGVLFYFGWLMLWPVALRYQVSDVHATNGWMAIYSATNAICTMIALPIWRKMSQKSSAGQLLALAAGLMAITPFIYSFSPSLQGIRSYLRQHYWRAGWCGIKLVVVCKVNGGGTRGRSVVGGRSQCGHDRVGGSCRGTKRCRLVGVWPGGIAFSDINRDPHSRGGFVLLEHPSAGPTLDGTAGFKVIKIRRRP
jgi:hypothetical protein